MSSSEDQRPAPGGAAIALDEPEPLLSVVIPCLNEEENIEACVRGTLEVMDRERIVGEVVVADNASDDRSAELAAAAGAHVVAEPRRGYGSAYLAGFAAARGRYILMVDADLTYDFDYIPRFVEELESGADFVIGDRMDNIKPGAMPWHHRYIGNFVLSGTLNLFFRTGVRDAHCGMRALRRDVLERLDLRTTGMEFASEMVIRAAKEGLAIRQFPIEYLPRGGKSKLSSFRDGWRHLRFLLVHSPTYLFILPGLAISLLGALAMVLGLLELSFLGRTWQLHTEIAGALAFVVGTQVLCLGVCAQTYGAYFMGAKDPWFDRMRARLRLEHGLLTGGAITLVGALLALVIVVRWIDRGLGALSEERLAVAAATLIVVGLQVFFTSFLLSILGLRRMR